MVAESSVKNHQISFGSNEPLKENTTMDQQSMSAADKYKWNNKYSGRDNASSYQQRTYNDYG